jgi:hypothetical protein
MKKSSPSPSLSLALLLTLAAPLHAEKPDPQSFTIDAHVDSCRLISQCTSISGGSGTCGYAQHIAATIGGKKFELERLVETNMLRAGNYKVKLLTDKHPRPEEYTQIYEFLFSDGKTGDFLVVAEPQ